MSQCTAVDNIVSVADKFNVDEITKSVEAGSGSDPLSDNVDTVVGGEVEGRCTQTVINYVTDVP